MPAPLRAVHAAAPGHNLRDATVAWAVATSDLADQLKAVCEDGLSTRDDLYALAVAQLAASAKLHELITGLLGTAVAGELDARARGARLASAGRHHQSGR